MANNWVAFLERQQRSILSKAGAGKTPNFGLYDDARWERECVLQTGASPVVARLVSQEIRTALEAAYDPLAPVQAMKTVYADFRSRFEDELLPNAADNPAMVSGGTGDHLVYKLFDGSRRLLYVGITSRGPQRLVEHHRTKPWFQDVENILFERFLTRDECAAREVALIRELHPAFNVQHNGCLSKV